MKVIIAGSRTITDIELVAAAVADSGFVVTEVIEGEASGVDRLAKKWANANNIPVRPFPADWKDLSHPDAIIRSNRYGQYDAKAGHRRNALMAKYADAAVIIWENRSGGSLNMMQQIDSLGKPFHLAIKNLGAFTVDELNWLRRSDESKRQLPLP